MGRMGDTWRAVMAHEKDDRRHVRGDVANDLRDDEVETILATYDLFGCSPQMLRQIMSDLASASYLKACGLWALAPRYRVFDWLAMMVQTGDETLHKHGAYAGTQVMVHSFLKCGGDVDRFIEDLRVSDYDCDHSWESVDLNA